MKTYTSNTFSNILFFFLQPLYLCQNIYIKYIVKKSPQQQPNNIQENPTPPLTETALAAKEQSRDTETPANKTQEQPTIINTTTTVAENTIVGLQKTIKKLKHTAEVNELAVQKISAENVGVNQENVRLRAKIKDNEATIKTLRAHKANAITELTQTTAELLQRQKQHATALQNSATELETKHNREKEQLENKIRELTMDNTRLKTEMEQFQDQIKNLNSRLHEQERDNIFFQEQLQSLNTDVAKSKQQIINKHQNHKHELDELRTKINLLESNNKKLHHAEQQVTADLKLVLSTDYEIIHKMKTQIIKVSDALINYDKNATQIKTQLILKNQLEQELVQHTADVDKYNTIVRRVSSSSLTGWHHTTLGPLEHNGKLHAEALSKQAETEVALNALNSKLEHGKNIIRKMKSDMDDTLNEVTTKVYVLQGQRQLLWTKYFISTALPIKPREPMPTPNTDEPKQDLVKTVMLLATPPVYKPITTNSNNNTNKQRPNNNFKGNDDDDKDNKTLLPNSINKESHVELD